MKIYLVGGAVRDKLLGLPIKERDWVVVGATIKDMQALGYRQVGKEFPVFLHPKTNEEYALARLERKTAPGYKGFTFDTSPTVTLEDDLSRRDLTINAMAEDESGQLIDPYQGENDLKAKRLKHVSPAFSEDPVRILRVARFLSRYAHLGFSIAPETMTLMQRMTLAGEVDALVAERVWKEWERALTEKNPEMFFQALNECNSLPILFAPFTIENPGLIALQHATSLSPSALVRLAALMYALPPPSISHLCQRYRLPNAYRELALLTARHAATALQAQSLSAEALIQLFTSLDIFRREDRFHNFLTACQAIAASQHRPFDIVWLKNAAAVAKSFDVQTLIAQGLAGQALAAALKEKRKEQVAHWLNGLL